MKKLGKKLSLNRETLRNLGDGQLQGAAGGYSRRCTEAVSCDGNSAYYVCDYTLMTDCTINTCGGSCPI